MEQILQQILTELQNLREGQDRIEATQQKHSQELAKQGEELTGLRAEVQKQGEELTGLRTDVADIKTELRYVWEDIKRIDKRLSTHDEELVILKRLK